MTVAPGVTVTFTCTGSADAFLPTWFVNGTMAVSGGHTCYRSTYSRRPRELNATATLTINGNNSCNVFSVYCRIFRESKLLYLHNTTLTVQGWYVIGQLETIFSYGTYVATSVYINVA